MPFRPFILDRYILGQVVGTMCAVLAVVMSLMILEHLPRLMEITRLSGHRGYIVFHTVVGLLPEYGGIGLLVALYLGVALTTRRLALRGELEMMGACGISPLAWMRFPLALTAIVSLLTLLNQGWLMPAGEVRLADIGKRMEQGEFGHRLPAGQFVDLGSGSTLLFRHVDPLNGELVGLFLQTEGITFTARRGVFRQLPSGTTAIELHDGQMIRGPTEHAVEFARFVYRSDGMDRARVAESSDTLLRRADIASLWANNSASSRSAVYGRSLWAALALFLAPVAMVLGKPPRRQSGAVGILVGMISLVLGLKMTAPLIDGYSSEPELLAAATLFAWGSTVSGLILAEKALGQGFVDLWVSRILENFRRPTV